MVNLYVIVKLLCKFNLERKNESSDNETIYLKHILSILFYFFLTFFFTSKKELSDNKESF